MILTFLCVNEHHFQIETGIMIGLPDATEDQVEELMAILTVSARSLMRKVMHPPSFALPSPLATLMSRDDFAPQALASPQGEGEAAHPCADQTFLPFPFFMPLRLRSPAGHAS